MEETIGATGQICVNALHRQSESLAMHATFQRARAYFNVAARGVV
jgi:hypothetical protein